jgi:hypothetical protein
MLTQKESACLSRSSMGIEGTKHSKDEAHVLYPLDIPQHYN